MRIFAVCLLCLLCCGAGTGFSQEKKAPPSDKTRPAPPPEPAPQTAPAPDKAGESKEQAKAAAPAKADGSGQPAEVAPAPGKAGKSGEPAEAPSEQKKTVESKGKSREPFRITREFQAQLEEVEPPEIEVTGVFQARGESVAMARLQLEKVEGRVVLKPGMRVSIPKPNRNEAESEKWMTYFTVKEVDMSGMVIVLENGETVWYPVMGELD